MKAEQIVFPFPGLRRESAVKPPNVDPVGRSYTDGASKVRVVAVSPADANQVVVERDLDGKRWAAPVNDIRHIVARNRRSPLPNLDGGSP
jgi:hypothetical protein